MHKLMALLILLSFSSLKAQQSPVAPWIGDWSGTLEIHNAEGLRQSVAMELNIAQLTDSTWTWQIVYGEGEARQERNYELVKIDGTGNYVVDEKNSIKLDLNLINNPSSAFSR